ncbi:MAG: RNA 2',3'-cyclic phosphodiesterase, partial [Thermoplasmatota archaeon]
PCRIEGRGAFPKPSQARVAWLGVDAPGLEALARCVVDATGGFGQPPDRRRFRPHVTLARLKRPADLRPWVQQEAPGEAGHLAEVVLYRSELGPDGPSYVPLHRWSLSDPAP